MDFQKRIILHINLLNINLLDDMTLFEEASYTIITPKQFVLVIKSISFSVVETISKRPKQIVLLLQRYFLLPVLPIFKHLNHYHKTCYTHL